VRFAGFDIGSAVRPADGFACGGDAAVAHEVAGRLILAIIDILGHGPEAHTVAARAQDLLEGSEVSEPAALLAMLEDELAGSLGAAIGIASLAPAGPCTFAGIGNAVARVFGRAERRLVSVDGIVGQRRSTPRPVSFQLNPGDVLVLHSDGITSRLALADYPALLSEDPQVAARELVRRFGRSHDDAACIVARCTP
jgi:serine phosphatase RsbU (regulator of sigma subunit)